MHKWILILLLLTSCSTEKKLDYRDVSCYPTKGGIYMEEERGICTINFDMKER
jgi:hypothetical protein